MSAILRALLLRILCLFVAIVAQAGAPASASASDLQFDRTRLWVEAGAAIGVADSGQTRFSVAIGGAWYPTARLGVGVGIGMTDVFENPEFLASFTYRVYVFPVYAQVEWTAWRKGSMGLFLLSEVGFATWVTATGIPTEFGSTHRSYSGAHLAFGAGARHRLPGARIGVFGQVRYMPEVGPDLAWPLVSFTVGIEG